LDTEEEEEKDGWFWLIFFYFSSPPFLFLSFFVSLLGGCSNREEWREEKVGCGGRLVCVYVKLSRHV
jgi:hypothetical protein